jgi:hypothetical protein
MDKCHGQDHHQLWLPVWLPDDHLKESRHASGLLKQWAQVGSNHRPLACKTSYCGRWTWLDVARRGICQP